MLSLQKYKEWLHVFMPWKSTDWKQPKEGCRRDLFSGHLYMSNNSVEKKSCTLIPGISMTLCLQWPRYWTVLLCVIQIPNVIFFQTPNYNFLFQATMPRFWLTDKRDPERLTRWGRVVASWHPWNSRVSFPVQSGKFLPGWTECKITCSQFESPSSNCTKSSCTISFQHR